MKLFENQSIFNYFLEKVLLILFLIKIKFLETEKFCLTWYFIRHSTHIFTSKNNYKTRVYTILEGKNGPAYYSFRFLSRECRYHNIAEKYFFRNLIIELIDTQISKIFHCNIYICVTKKSYFFAPLLSLVDVMGCKCFAFSPLKEWLLIVNTSKTKHLLSSKDTWEIVSP